MVQEGKCKVPWVGFHFGRPESTGEGRVDSMAGSESKQALGKSLTTDMLDFSTVACFSLFASLDPEIIRFFCLCRVISHLRTLLQQALTSYFISSH